MYDKNIFKIFLKYFQFLRKILIFYDFIAYQKVPLYFTCFIKYTKNNLPNNQFMFLFASFKTWNYLIFIANITTYLCLVYKFKAWNWKIIFKWIWIIHKHWTYFLHQTIQCDCWSLIALSQTSPWNKFVEFFSLSIDWKGSGNNGDGGCKITDLTTRIPF